MFGKCRLCHEERDLQDSHIIPKWAWRRARAYSTERNPNPVVVQGDVAFETSKQTTEYLLCLACERRLSPIEDYVSKITYQLDDSAPLLSLVGAVVERRERLRMVAAGALDHEKVAYFGASVVWRASVARSVPECELGSKYNEDFRCYLQGEGPLPPQCSVVVIFNDLEMEGVGNVAAMTALPYSERFGAYHLHRFPIFGLQFFVAVGNRLPRWAHANCIVRSAEHRVLLMPQEELIRWLGPLVLKARPLGRLAKRQP